MQIATPLLYRLSGRQANFLFLKYASIISTSLLLHFSVYSQISTYTEKFDGSTQDLDKAPWSIHGWGTTVEGTNMGTGTATIIDDPTENGNRVLKLDKIVPPPGEKYNSNSSREEIKYLSKAKEIPGAPAAFAPWFVPISYRWRFYFTGDHDWDIPENGNFVVGQWHHSPQMNVSGGPPGNFRVVGKDLWFKARWASAEDPTNDDVEEAHYLVWEDLKKNTWYHIVVDITWDHREGKTGQIKAYLREGDWPSASDLVMDHSGPGKATGYNWTFTNFAQVGLYAWRWRNPKGADKSRAAGVEKFEYLIDDWEYTEGRHYFSSGNVNQVPNVNAGAGKTITLPNNNVTLNGSASDPDGSITSYQWIQKTGPNNATLTGAHKPTVEIGNLLEGSYVFRFTVTDNDGATSSDEVSVNVKADSQQDPIADAGPSKHITLPADSATLNGSGTDPNGSIVSYQWVQFSGPASAILTGSNSADAAVSNLIEGNYVFELTVTDNDGNTGSDKMFVSVTAGTNLDPSADAGPNQTIILPDDRVTLNGSASDPDGSIVSRQWTQQQGPNNATLNGANTDSLEASGLIEGPYIFRLTIIDDDGATTYDEVTVTVVSAPNQQPNADAGPNQTITLPDDQVTLTGAAADTDGSITSYQWSQQNGPNNAILNGVNNLSVEVNGLSEGVYVFRLTVIDNGGATASDDVSVSVEADSIQAPIADAGPSKHITLPADSVALSGSGTDPNGSIVSFQWVQFSGPTTAVLTGSNTADARAENLTEGTYVFELTVTDNDGNTGVDKMFVEVKAVPNQDPVANAGPNQTIALPIDKVILNGSATDADGFITSYQWIQQQGPNNAILTGANSASMEASGLIVGTYVFSLTVTDDQGATDTEELTVILHSAPPTVAATITDAACIVINGAISLVLTGGQGPFNFSWSNGATTKDLTDVAPGNYQVTITDQNGYSVNESYTVGSAPADLSVTAEIDNASCASDNGAIRVRVTGGTEPYSFAWSKGGSTENIHGLAGGTYDLTVTDNNGCQKQVTFEVPIEPGRTEFELQSEVVDASCSNADGSINVQVVGDRGPYTFLWTNGATTPNLSGLGLGVYQVLITDRHGCFMEETFIIDQNSISDPVIIRSGDSLYVEQQATHYQWYKEGIVLEGETQNHLIVSEPGNYRIQIAEGYCTNISAPYTISEELKPISGTYNVQQVKIFPNPVTDYMTLRVQLNESTETDISIHDFQGNQVMGQELGMISSETTTQLDLSGLPSGIFFIKISIGQELVTRKFIKQSGPKYFK